MNSLERVSCVLEHKIPDRVPVALHNFLMTGRFIGCSDLSVMLQDGDLMAESQIKAWEYFQHDVIQIENGVCALAQALGCEVIYPKNQPPHVVKTVLDDLNAVEKLKLPDPEKTFPLNQVVKATRIISRELGKKVFLVGRADQGPMALALTIYGVEKFLLDITDPDKEERIKYLLDFCGRCNVIYGLAHGKAGAHATCIGGVGLSLISPAMYQKYEFPFQTKYVSEIKKQRMKAFIHICGKEDAILNDMVNTGADSLELDPLTHPLPAKRAARGKTTLLGFIDPVEVANGTPESVKEKSREMIAALGPDGGFILSPGCALPIDTPLENVKALVDAAKEYGGYHMV
ncbi:MAG: uroporphyrinogen decarboxylase family protein [Candidatus Ratteibacteria bacterium]|jgi:MtaA/CmuA family methyltransferase